MRSSHKLIQLTSLFLILLLASCAQSETQSIKVGVVSPMTGFLAFFGEYLNDGFSLRLDEVNAQGGVNGRQIELIHEDTKCIDHKGTTTALNKFANIDQVDAVLGPFCGGTNHLAGTFSTEHSTFVMSPGDNFGHIGEYMINTRYPLRDEAKLLVDYAAEQKLMKLAILYYNNEWGVGYLEGIRDQIEVHGGEVVAHESYLVDDFGDLRSHLLKLTQAEPDALVIIDSTSGDVFKQAHELGIDLPILSEWEIQTSILKGAYNPGMEDVVFAVPVVQKSAFHTAFQEKYGKEPNLIHADAYDAADLLVKAMQHCQDLDEVCMTEYVSSLKDYPGAAGNLTFDKEQWAFKKPFQYMQVKDGEMVLLE